MAKYIGTTWECESCGEWEHEKPWACPGCGKEVCDSCFNSYMHCRECSEKTPVAELKRAAEAMYMVEF